MIVVVVAKKRSLCYANLKPELSMLRGISNLNRRVLVSFFHFASNNTRARCMSQSTESMRLLHNCLTKTVSPNQSSDNHIKIKKNCSKHTNTEMVFLARTFLPLLMAGAVLGRFLYPDTLLLAVDAMPSKFLKTLSSRPRRNPCLLSLYRLAALQHLKFQLCMTIPKVSEDCQDPAPTSQ